MRRSLLISAVGVLVLTTTPAVAQTAVRVGQPLARSVLLKPGVHRYARYRIEAGRRTLVDLWTRTLSFEAHDGRASMRIQQRWDVAAPRPGGLRTLEQDSWFEPRTFRPLTHVRRETRDGSAVVKGYRFLPGKTVGLDGLPDNAATSFSLDTAEPPFNFEYDMELLQALPLADGYAADIVFYDAGIDPKADHYTFKVAGSEDIAGWDGRPVHCWVVTADYNTGVVRARFWFDKRSQVLVREATDLPDGARLIKTLLPPEPGD